MGKGVGGEDGVPQHFGNVSITLMGVVMESIDFKTLASPNLEKVATPLPEYAKSEFCFV